MNSRTSVGYGDMWAKTILETYEAEEDDGRYSGGSSPESTGFVETSISSHFGGMNYPSLFSSKPSSHGASQQTIREEPPSYSTSVLQRKESFENPLAGRGGQSFGSHEDEDKSSGNPQSGKALYDFTAGGDDELSLTTGEEVRLNMRSMVGIIFVCSNFQQFSSFIYTPVGKASSCMSNKCHLLKKRRGSISGFLFFIFARDLYLFFRLYETLHY